jgi:hypothetical protein
MRLSFIHVAVLAGTITATGCGQHAARSSSLSNKEQSDLSASLAKLDETLASKSRFIFAKLLPGATQPDIDALRKGLGGSQIECLEVWYKWHNGCADRITDLLPLGRMLSINESLENRKQIQSIPFVDAKRKSALKILEDSAGDGFFLDVESQNPRVFYHMLEDPYPRDYGTFVEFISFIRDVHEAGIVSENKHSMADFDLNRYQKIEADYLKSLTKPDR